MKRLLLVFVVPLAWSARAADRVPIDVVLVAGQSNAVGFNSDPALLPPDPQDHRILFWWQCGDPPPSAHDSSSGNRWTFLQLQPKGGPLPLDSDKRQFGNFSDAKGGFGPEIGFARALARRTVVRLAVVKVAFNGTGLQTDWSPRTDGPQGECYRALVARTWEAVRALRADGFDPELTALAWVQGESDCKPADAGLYRSRMIAFIRDLREDLGAPRLFVLMGFNDRVDGAGNPSAEQVVAAQEAVARDLPDCAYVDTDGAQLANRYHFTSAGNLEVGRRFAAALLEAECRERPVVQTSAGRSRS